MDGNGLAVEQNLAAMLPRARRMLDQRTAALARDPPLLPANELLGLAPRAAAWHGDAKRAVGPDAEDIATRRAHTHELDRVLRILGRTRRQLANQRIGIPKEREVKLH